MWYDIDSCLGVLRQATCQRCGVDPHGVVSLGLLLGRFRVVYHVGGGGPAESGGPHVALGLLRGQYLEAEEPGQEVCGL